MLHKTITGDINLLIKLQNDKVISFKQKLKEYVFYILPKSHSARRRSISTAIKKRSSYFKKYFGMKSIQILQTKKRQD